MGTTGMSLNLLMHLDCRSIWDLCDDLLSVHEVATVPQFLPDGCHAGFDHGSLCDQNKPSLEFLGFPTPKQYRIKLHW